MAGNKKRKKYAEYLRSDHWRDLNQAKRDSGEPVACGVCGSSVGLHLHHLVYRNLVDVTCEDLRWVCSGCHKLIHGLLETRRLVYRSEVPADRWEATLAALGGLPDPVKQRKKLRKRMRHGIDPWANLPVRTSSGLERN